MRFGGYILLVLLGCIAQQLQAQDTFYVKKHTAVQVVQTQIIYADTTVRDSIVSYTAEYQKPGSTIYSRIHMKGPYLQIPPDVQGTGQRVLFTEIIAIDRNGRRYRQPDRYYAGGVWVPAKKPK